MINTDSILRRILALEKALEKAKRLITGGPGYFSYTALVTFSGSSTPAANVLRNETGATITPSRVGTGNYNFSISGGIAYTYLFVIAPSAFKEKTGGIVVFSWAVTAGNVALSSFNPTPAVVDFGFDNLPLEFRFYI